MKENFSADDMVIQFSEVIDGVEVNVRKNLEGSTLIFPDGTVSILHDDGRSTTFHLDGGMTCIDPEENFYSHQSGVELESQAKDLEVIIRGIINQAKPE